MQVIRHMLSYDMCVTQIHCVIAVRLAGGPSAREGRLEVYFYAPVEFGWGTVCDDGFTDAAARVVCYMLGYG